MWNKITRNTAIIAGFCLCLFLIIQLGNWILGRRNESFQATEIQRTKELAYVNLNQYNLDESLNHFEVLLKHDPYDGHAHYGKATALRRKYYGNCKKSSLSESELKAEGEKVIEQYEVAYQFPRYRNRCLHSMSMIHAHIGNDDKAYELLVEAFNNGFYTNMRNYLEDEYGRFYYAKVKDQRRFKVLRRLEYRNYVSSKGVETPSVGGGQSKRNRD